jgi:hypothetical protein
MKTNKLGYVGMLGLSGLIGILNPWLFSLFSFFSFFVFFKSDERTDQNIGRASRNAFIYDTIIATLTMAYILTAQPFENMPLFAALLAQGILIFNISYWHYQEKGE